MKCPRCNKKVNCVGSDGKGLFDKLSQKTWAISHFHADITEEEMNELMICKECQHEIKMQNPKYTKEYEDDLKYNQLVQVSHTLINSTNRK